jgi:hypothetical protein
MQAQLVPPMQRGERIQFSLRVDPDLVRVLNRVGKAKGMKKVDVYNQALRWGLVALGELPPPAA